MIPYGPVILYGDYNDLDSSISVGFFSVFEIIKS